MITSRGSVLLIGLAFLAGTVQGLIVPVTAGSTVGYDVRLPPPGPALGAAREGAPYELKEPRYLPPSFSLFNVIVTEPDVGEEAYSVDLWYTSDGQEFVHIWQTNHRELGAVGKDPSMPGPSRASVMLNGRLWQQEQIPDAGLIALSTRFDDGITLSLDGNVGERELRRIAASIQ